MSRQWQPGDVAIAYDDAWSIRVVRHSGSPDYWSAANGVWPLGVRDDLLDYRPLAVIDPEDREQVERLVKVYNNGEVEGEWVDAMQAAFRTLVAPPKPDEPTGLGAVVEDADGTPWVRCENADLEPHWYARNKRRDYADIDAVKVLSEGVTA